MQVTLLASKTRRHKTCQTSYVGKKPTFCSNFSDCSKAGTHHTACNDATTHDLQLVTTQLARAVTWGVQRSIDHLTTQVLGMWHYATPAVGGTLSCLFPSAQVTPAGLGPSGQPILLLNKLTYLTYNYGYDYFGCKQIEQRTISSLLYHPRPRDLCVHNCLRNDSSAQARRPHSYAVKTVNSQQRPDLSWKRRRTATLGSTQLQAQRRTYDNQPHSRHCNPPLPGRSLTGWCRRPDELCAGRSGCLKWVACCILPAATPGPIILGDGAVTYLSLSLSFLCWTLRRLCSICYVRMQA